MVIMTLNVLIIIMSAKTTSVKVNHSVDRSLTLVEPVVTRWIILILFAANTLSEDCEKFVQAS